MRLFARCILLSAFLLTALDNRPAAAQDAQPLGASDELVPELLREANTWLIAAMDGIGQSTQVALEPIGNVVHFRATRATLTTAVDSLVVGAIELDSAGLVSLRIDPQSSVLERHLALRRRVNQLGADGRTVALLLENDGARFPVDHPERLIKAMSQVPLARRLGASLTVEDAVFETRHPHRAERVDTGDVLAAWKVTLRIGRGSASRRFAATIDPITGLFIDIQRQ